MYKRKSQKPKRIKTHTELTSEQTIGSDILPSLDSTYDLGSPTQKWKDLYLSGSTINLGNKTISQSGNNLVIGNASAVVATAFIGDGSGLTGISGGGGGLTEDDVIDLINQNQQSGGINARAVKILPLNGQVIRYDSDGNEEDTLTFRAVPENGANTLTYKWSVKAAAAPDTSWTVEQDGPSTDFTLADADEPGAEGVKVIKCEMYENTDGTDSAEKAQDIMTVYGLANGFGITGFLTNESHVEPADSTGSLTTAVNDAGGTFKVFLGTNDITTDPAVTFSNPSKSGINVTIDNNGVYALNSSPNADAAFASLGTLAGSAVFEANIGSSLIPNSNTDMVIEKKYTIAKSLRGSTGPSGTGVGNPGVDARAVKLVPNNGQVIRYSADGSTETDTLTFTAEPNEAFTGTKTYDFAVKKGGSSFDPKQVQGSSANFTLADVDEPNVDSAYVVRVQAYEDNVIKARDFVTIYGLADGTSITAFLTNEAHVEGYDSDGNLVDNFNDAGGTFKVFRGTTEITTGYGCTFSVDTESGVDVEIGATTGIYVVNGFSATKKGYADFQVEIPASLINGATSPLLIDKRYSISKSGDGSSGANGTSPITLDLTNENHSVTAARDGSPYTNSFNGAVTTLNIYDGADVLSVPSNDITVSPISSTVSASYTLSNNNRTLTVTNMADDVDVSTLTFNIGGSTAASGKSTVFTLTKVKDGQDGSGITVDLTNENHSITATNAGTAYSYTGATTTLNAFNGSSPLTIASGDISISSSVAKATSEGNRGANNIDYTVSNGNKTVTIDWMGANVDEVAITFSITGGLANGKSKVFSVSKIKDGDNGDPATVYRLRLGSYVINKASDGTYTPPTFTATKQKGVGSATPADTTDGTLRIYRNGATGSSNAVATSTTTTSASFTISADTTELRAEYTVNNVVVDDETIPVVDDGSAATVYRLVTSSNTVVLDSDGTTFRPPSLSLSQQRVIGNQTPTSADYGRIRARITNNGTTDQSFSVIPDDANGVATYNLATGDELIELDMQVLDDNSNWVTVDEESIPVISDASSGEGGRGPGTWWIYIGTSTSSQPTTSGQADTAWANHAPAEAGSPVEGDQAWFYTGTGVAAAPTSQTVWLRGASSWSKQERVIRGDLLVDGTVTADQFATSGISTTETNVGRTIIKNESIEIQSHDGANYVTRVLIGKLS